MSPTSAQQTFATPEEAVENLRKAVGGDSDDSWKALLGDHNTELLPKDAVTRTESLRLLGLLMEERLYLAPIEGGNIVRLGLEGWPFPVPLMQTKSGWAFNSEAGPEEIWNRTVGRNELLALETLLRLVDAQESYRKQDPDNDGVRAYSSKFESSEGRKDGLYWPVEDGSVSPLETMLRDAFKYAEGRTKGSPWFGYRFRMLNEGQARSAPGGAFKYHVNGFQMTGYAIVAYPATYGKSGVMTFLCNQNGRIYESDLGEETSKKAERIRLFELSPDWEEVLHRENL